MPAAITAAAAMFPGLHVANARISLATHHQNKCFPCVFARCHPSLLSVLSIVNLEARIVCNRSCEKGRRRLLGPRLAVWRSVVNCGRRPRVYAARFKNAGLADTLRRIWECRWGGQPRRHMLPDGRVAHCISPVNEPFLDRRGNLLQASRLERQ